MTCAVQFVLVIVVGENVIGEWKKTQDDQIKRKQGKNNGNDTKSGSGTESSG